MTDDLNQGAPLVECSIIADSARDLPAGDLLTATTIAADLIGRPVRVEPGADDRTWLVAFSDAELAELRSEGLFERTTETTYLLAEWPQ